MIIDSKLSLESYFYSDCRPNLLESVFEQSTIRFGTPNCISLDFTYIIVIKSNIMLTHGIDCYLEILALVELFLT